MVIDTSAIVAILNREPEADAMIKAIGTAEVRLIAAASILETSIVIEHRFGEVGGRELDLFLHRANIDTISVTAEHIDIARYAFRQFGKGRGHPAQLNFGDCFAYALAKATQEALLFKGRDFSQTDINTVKYVDTINHN